MKIHRLIGVLVVVLACLAIAGTALATKGSGPKQSPRPAGVHAATQSSEQPSESENSTESEAGQQGEPTQGHEDPAGQDVNHECTGNCQE